MNPKADFYFNKDCKWQKEIRKLRTILLDCLLTEELKWGVPCYTFDGRNIVLIHMFKDYCAILFFKGVLLSDTHGILVQQTKLVQSARQIRFTNLQQLVKLVPIVKAYIYEAIEVERAGLQVKLKKTEEFPVPDEFQKRLDKSAKLKKAFQGLTPGRQRAYLYYFSAPKLSQTRESRVKKYIPAILEGKGLDD